jgi:hypothetical protein
MRKNTTSKKNNSHNHSQKFASRFLEKQIHKNNDFATWLVNGAMIRRDINENFVECGGNDQYSFVPKNQFWIDKDLDPKEYHYFISRFIYETSLISSGKKYKEANKKGDIFEKKERSKSPEYKKLIKNNADINKLLKKTKKKIIKRYSENIKVWLVNGNLVRDLFLVNFCEGGHDKIFPFIPKNEIWIEEAISPTERKFIIVHELHERYLMMQGKSYKNGHLGATEIEDFFRENPKEDLEKRIKEEIRKNNDFKA